MGRAQIYRQVFAGRRWHYEKAKDLCSPIMIVRAKRHLTHRIFMILAGSKSVGITTIAMQVPTGVFASWHARLLELPRPIRAEDVLLNQSFHEHAITFLMNSSFGA